MKTLLSISLFFALSFSASAQSFSGQSSGDVFVVPPYRLCVGQDDGKNVCFTQNGAKSAAFLGTLNGLFNGPLTGGPVTGPLQMSYLNSVNGTSLAGLAKVDQVVSAGATGLAVCTAPNDQLPILGVVTAGAGTGGPVTIATSGLVQVVFDSASVSVGNAVGISTTTSCAAMDLGSPAPTSATNILGVITVSPTGALPSACTNGCWILLGAPGAGGGGGGGNANAVVKNPPATQTVTPTVAAATPIITACNAGAGSTQPCGQISDGSGNALLVAQQNGIVALGKASATPNVGSNSTLNTDWGGILTAVANTATYTFTGSYTNHPLCFGIDLTGGHTGYLVPTYTGTTAVSFTTGGATDTVQYHCPYTK